MSVEISIVVPLYNKRDYILRCLESIRRQTFADFEVIVVDDGSTDDSSSVARVEDPRFRLIRQRNGGPGAARNRGIRESTSGLIAFLDADDEWRPGFLEAILGLARRYPEAGLFATGHRRTYGRDYDREVTVASSDGVPVEISNYLELATEGNFVTSSSVAVRRTVLGEVGFFPEGEPLGEDLDLWVRIGLRYRLAFDTRILAIYHSEAAGGSFERCGTPPFPPVVRTLRRILAEGEVPDAINSMVIAYIDRRMLEHAQRLLHLGQRQELLRFLRQEQFQTSRHAWEATLLRTGASILPLQLVFALRWKPFNLLESIRRLYRRDSDWVGTHVINRMVPAGGWDR